VASVRKCIIGAVAAATVTAGLGTAAVGSAVATPAVTSAHALALSKVATTQPTVTTLHGEAVMKLAAAALVKQSGFRMAGNAADDDNPFVSEYHLDAIMMAGGETSAVLTQGDDTINIRAVGGRAYFQAPADVYLQGGVDAFGAALLDDRWVKPSVADSKDLLDGLTLSTVAAALKDPKKTPVIDAVTQETRGGRSLLVVTDKKDGYKFYIDPVTYLPAEMVQAPGVNGSEDTDFLDYGVSVPVSVPADALDTDAASSTINQAPSSLSA
jgi:hypothetical protein